MKRLIVLVVCCSLSFVDATPVDGVTSLPRLRAPIKVPYVPPSFQMGPFVTPQSLTPVSPLELAKSALLPLLPVGTSLVLTDHVVTDHNQVEHFYFRQQIHGLDVFNGDCQVNILGEEILSVSESAFKGVVASSSLETASFTSELPLTASEALQSLYKHLGLSMSSGFFSSSSLQEKILSDIEVDLESVPFAKEAVRAKKGYYQVQDETTGEIRLVRVWSLQVDLGENYYQSFVVSDKSSGINSENGVIALIDWVHEAAYYVYPLGVNDPEEGERVLLENPHNKVASPHGWHFSDSQETRGFNVIAQENMAGDDKWETKKRPQGGASLTFKFEADLKQEPNTYLDASVTNLFYWNNVMHDLYYAFGFDEKSGNFQEDNYGRGGKDMDAVIAHAQYGCLKDEKYVNNALFASPPDGIPGRMYMYIWNKSIPHRDGDFEAGIIIHEYAHGISSRLTGGPSNGDCLADSESGGMGEGWGDFLSVAMRMRSNYTSRQEFAMASYSVNDKKGIRQFPYSTSLENNPSTYNSTRKFRFWQVHDKGAVWGAILYEVYWAMVERFGYEDLTMNPKTMEPKTSTSNFGISIPGNIRIIQNVIDGMKLQPCRPSFVDARNAILLADKVNYQSEGVCVMWHAFAKRGLGVYAKSGGEQDFNVPNECRPYNLN